MNTSILTIKLAFRLSAIYFACWILLFVVFPDLVAKEVYSSEITPVTQKLMNHIIFLWGAMIAIHWSLPSIADSKTQHTFGMYSAAFWLIGSLANLANMTFVLGDVGVLAVVRLAIELMLGIMFAIVARRHRKSRLTSFQQML